METQTATLLEIITLTLFLGSIVYLLSASCQVFVLLRVYKIKSFCRILGIVLLTRIATITLTILILKIAFQNIEIMFGPILLPGMIAEIVLSTLILKLLKIKNKKNL